MLKMGKTRKIKRHNAFPAFMKGKAFLALLSMFVFPVLLAGSLAHAATFGVPGDYATIQLAVSNAPDGSTIEVQPGTYREFIAATNLKKNLYLKAMGTVEIDGEGSRKLLHVINDGNGDPDKNLLIDGFTFMNGYDGGTTSSPVTIADAKPQFINCSFVNNNTRVKGGAVLIYGSDASPLFHNCTFTGNESLATAGAVLVNGGHAQAIFRKCLFENNTNRESGSAAQYGEGGAILFSEAGGEIIDCTFRNNSTAYAGGAVMVLTWWNTSADTVEIRKSRFENNFCLPVAGKDPPQPTEGGAIMAENNVTVTVKECSFTGNHAEAGGAIMSYRSNLEISDSVFDGNSATGTNYLGFGGAVAVNMNDAGDSDRREGTASLSNVLIRNSVAPVGGGFYAVGDSAHGDPVSVTFDRVVLDNNLATTSGSSYGNGGGLFLELTTFTASNTYILNNTAEYVGGGIVIIQGTSLALYDSYVVGNDGMFDPSMHNPQSLPYTSSNTIWAFNGGAPSADFVAFEAIPPIPIDGSGYLTYVVAPFSGPPAVSPGGEIIPDLGGYSAGSMSVTMGSDHALFTLTSGHPPQERWLLESYDDFYLPWIIDEELGLNYYWAGDESMDVLWSPSLGGYVTGPFFPYLYFLANETWYIYREGTSFPAYFQNQTTGEWETKWPYFDY